MLRMHACTCARDNPPPTADIRWNMRRIWRISKKADIRLAGRILAKTRGPYPPDPPADIRGYPPADLIRYKHGWTCYLTKNREKPYRWLQAPYQKCTAKFLWTSLPQNPLRESIHLLLWKKGISVDQPKTLLPLSNHCFSQSLLSKLWVRCFWLGDLDIQIFSSYGDRSQISQMKVTDGWGTVCCHHSAKKGVYLASSYFAFLRLVPDWIRVRGC